MPLEPGETAQVWLDAAREHFAATEVDANPVRVRCFHGQRTVELAVKAVLFHHGVRFPFIHALQELIALVPGEVPHAIREAAALTTYAVEEMYPDTFTNLNDDHATEAVDFARAVVEWAAGTIEPGK